MAEYEKPRYVTKMAAKVLDQDSKLDLLLKKMEDAECKQEESEKRREQSTEKSRAEFLVLKVVVESRFPEMEKRVDLLQDSVLELQEQVDKIQALVKSPDGMKSPPSSSPSSPTTDNSVSLGGSMGISGHVPPMSCPQFNGDSPQMWKSNCEEYFEIYGVHPRNWVRVAGLNFTGNATFWLQSIRSTLVGLSWQAFTDLVCLRFTKARQEVLIRQWFHLIQDSSVSDYVVKFDGIMHQLLAYKSALPLNYFVTKFVEGLKPVIRSSVLMQKPQDLDSACSLALLQEEILEGDQSSQYKRPELSVTYRHTNRLSSQAATSIPVTTVAAADDKKSIVTPVRPRDDKLAALKAYRRAKGLCFTCGERWGKDHKCAPAIQLHVVQELLEVLQVDDSLSDSLEDDSPQTAPTLMAISQQAISSTESPVSFRIRGWVQGVEVLMLIDSGSSHSFVDSALSQQLQGVQQLPNTVSVKVADGGLLSCSQFIPHCEWCTQGYVFHTEFKFLPLGTYDVILGMDWLMQLGPMSVDWTAKWMSF